MLYRYSITIWETIDNHVRSSVHQGVVSAKDFSGAAYWVVKKYTSTSASNENDIEKLTITPLYDSFGVGNVIETDEVSEYLIKNDR